MAFEALKQMVCAANKTVVEAGLVLLTWGNVSGADRDAAVMAIKPSGVDYDRLTSEDIVILDINTGETVEGRLRPSSDAPTHRALYQRFESVAGIVHTHSTHATSCAQAGREIPCMGTTHADHFYGAVPITRPMTPDEIASDYEWNTGIVIVERFEKGGLDPRQIPGVLVHGHGPFAWGADIESAVKNAVVLEETARTLLYTLTLNPSTQPISSALLDKHFLRKHGPDAYYGQNGYTPKD